MKFGDIVTWTPSGGASGVLRYMFVIRHGADKVHVIRVKDGSMFYFNRIDVRPIAAGEYLTTVR